MKLKKISLNKFDVATLSERELNQVLGGLKAATTAASSSSSLTASTSSSGSDNDSWESDSDFATPVIEL